MTVEQLQAQVSAVETSKHPAGISQHHLCITRFLRVVINHDPMQPVTVFPSFLINLDGIAGNTVIENTFPNIQSQLLLPYIPKQAVGL